MDPTRLVEHLVAPARKRLYIDLAGEVPIGARRVLHLDCGPADLAHAVAHYNKDVRVTGCDGDPVQTTLAKQRHRGQERLKFTRARPEATGFDDDRFDLVVTAERWPSWEDPLAVLDEAWRILRPGGALWLLTGRGDLTEEEMRESLDVPDLPGVYAATRAGFYLFGHSDRRIEEEIVPVFEKSRFRGASLEKRGAFALLVARKSS